MNWGTMAHVIGEWLLTAGVILWVVWFPLALMLLSLGGWALRKLQRWRHRGEDDGNEACDV